MNTKFKIFLVVLISLSGLKINAQTKQIKSGDYLYNHFQYYEALNKYLEAESLMEESDYELNRKIAHTYEKLNDYDNAAIWYEKIMGYKDLDYPDEILHYAKILCGIEQYEKAKLFFKKYYELIGLPEKYAFYESMCDWAILNKDNVKNIPITKTNLNIGGKSLGYTWYKEGLIFAKPFLSVYTEQTVYYDLAYAKKLEVGKFDNGVELQGNINQKYYESSPFITKDNKHLYFASNATTIEKYKDKQLKKQEVELSSKGVNVLKIYRAEWNGAQWINKVELPFNNKEYDCLYPALSDDGNTLYFVSNMPGGLGGFDIYKVVRDKAGNWSEPINLKEINTPFDEIAPFIDGNTLYFSSKGHKGFGGYDIFKTNINSIEINNLGKPFNSSRDDFAFILTPDKKTAFLSSNRESKNGNDVVFELSLSNIP